MKDRTSTRRCKQTDMHIFSLLFLATSALASTVRIQCNGSSHSQQFKSLFSLDILLNGDPQIHLGEEKGPELTKVTQVKVLTKQGSLILSKAVLNATLDLQDCLPVENLQCELYGLLKENHGYNKVRFRPRIHFKDTIDNRCIEIHKNAYRTNDISLVTCSADVGTNHTDWKWLVQAEGEKMTRRVDPKDVQTFPSELINCSYRTESRLIYINRDPGLVTFKCQIGNTIVGSVMAMVTVNESPVKNEEALGLSLFISTIVLVYPHFIYLPLIFAKWNICKPYRDTLTLKWRTFMSYIVGIMFLIVWVVTLLVFKDAKYMTSFLGFAITETILIIIYATLRLISWYFRRDFTNERIGLLNTAKVCASFGAVLVPFIYWVVMRIQGGTSNFPVEIIFYIFSLGSLVSFAYVSFEREGKYWDEMLRDHTEESERMR